MAHVGLASLGDRVVVDVDDLVQVFADGLGDLVQALEVVDLGDRVDEGGESDRSQVADSDLIGCTVLDDLCAKVGALDGTEVLLVALAVGSVLVKDEGVTSLGLGLEDGVQSF